MALSPQGNRQWVWPILLILCVLLFVLDLSLGSVNIAFTDTFHQLVGGGEANINHAIIFKLRLPRALAGIIVGAALAVGGLLMQSLFGNPLAGPSVLGISSGASLGVAMVVLLGGGSVSATYLSAVGLGQGAVVVGAALLGSFLVFMAILLLNNKLKDAVSLLIVGVMIGFLTNAVVAIAQFFSQPELIQDYLLWSLGSLAGLDFSQLSVMAIMVGLGIAGALLLAKPLNILLLGENYARTMGMPIRQLRMLIVAITSVLTAATVAFVGPIGFVGIAVPHLVRKIFLTANHWLLIPACGLTGAMLMLLCDIISKLPGSQAVLPLNAVTGLLGAPIVILVIINRRG